LVARLAEEGFDRRYGARPLQRTLEGRVVTPLARYLLERPGLRDAEVVADLDDAGHVTFR
jgi:ATP-dependent Clp protease ATP-binding subunit ClpA